MTGPKSPPIQKIPFYKIEITFPGSGRPVFFAELLPPSMTLVAAGFWPFICPGSGPKFARSEKVSCQRRTSRPLLSANLGGDLINAKMTVSHRQVPDLIVSRAENGLVLDTDVRKY